MLLAAPAALALGMLLAAPAAACPVCFGDPSSPQTKAAKVAILFLLGLTLLVGGGLTAFFIRVGRRSRRLQVGGAAESVADIQPSDETPPPAAAARRPAPPHNEPPARRAS